MANLWNLLSDGPVREPYIVFCHKGTHWIHIAIALEAVLQEFGLI